TGGPKLQVEPGAAILATNGNVALWYIDPPNSNFINIGKNATITSLSTPNSNSTANVYLLISPFQPSLVPGQNASSALGAMMGQMYPNGFPGSGSAPNFTVNIKNGGQTFFGQSNFQ